MEKTATEIQRNVRNIKLENEVLHFEYVSNNMLQDSKSIKAGYQYISVTYFKEEYPSEREITQALNYLEYELTKDKSLVNNNETLVCSNSVLVDMLKDIDGVSIDRATIEEVFNKYVDCATGEPAHLLGIDFTKEKLAVILVVRVVMYYLSFNQVNLK